MQTEGNQKGTAHMKLAKTKLSEREREVCVRLLAFREILQISRAKFAASIGIGSERLASYEAARAPLRYEVFRAIAEKYELNPTWLATGNQSPKLPVDYFAFEKEITRRTLFTEAYDRVLASSMEKLSEEAEHWSQEAELQKVETLLSESGIKSLGRLVEKYAHLFQEDDEILAFNILGTVHPDEKARARYREACLHKSHLSAVCTQFVDALGSKARCIGIGAVKSLVHSGTVHEGNYARLASYLRGVAV